VVEGERHVPIADSAHCNQRRYCSRSLSGSRATVKKKAHQILATAQEHSLKPRRVEWHSSSGVSLQRAKPSA